MCVTVGRGKGHPVKNFQEPVQQPTTHIIKKRRRVREKSRRGGEHIRLEGDGIEEKWQTDANKESDRASNK